MIIKYDPEATLSHGKYECQTCGVLFYGVGPRCCSCTSELIYHYTPAEKARLDKGEQPALAPEGLLRIFQAGNHYEPTEDEKAGGMIAKNACSCRICGGPADRYSTMFRCRDHPGHVADLNTGIFSDCTKDT
jgi:hypothetical protein